MRALYKHLLAPSILSGSAVLMIEVYVVVLRPFFNEFLGRKIHSEKDFLLLNILFNLARQCNCLLDKALVFSVRSLDEFKKI